MSNHCKISKTVYNKTFTGKRVWKKKKTFWVFNIFGIYVKMEFGAIGTIV